MRRGRVWAAALAAAGLAAMVTGIVTTPPARSATTLPGDLAVFGQTSTVGALFTLSTSGQLQNHFCTASVVDSPTGNLIVTAAHCMQRQRPAHIVFVPDYSAGLAPYGLWTVTKVIEDQPWLASGDPDDDFAFLVVSQRGSKVPVQTLTGGELVGVGQPAGRPVVVAGYPNLQDTPVSCQNTVSAFSATQFEFDCDGFTDGTSGSPLLAEPASVGSGAKAPAGSTAMVIGVIGGYEQGGYTASVSYAARFSSRLADLYQVAVTASSELGAAQVPPPGISITVAW
jgi:V8-like Glu-specific endopeptidase